MLTTRYAKSLPGIKINAIVALATVATDGPTGTFSDRRGAVAR